MTLDQAKDILFESTPVQTIISSYKGTNYIEFECRAGGDLLVYRVYNNGTITER